jgi:hypothetical protein
MNPDVQMTEAERTAARPTTSTSQPAVITPKLSKKQRKAQQKEKLPEPPDDDGDPSDPEFEPPGPDDDPDELNWDDFIGLFKGKDTIGNDGTAWREAAVYLNNLDRRTKARVIHSCVIFYEQPRRFLITGATRAGGVIGEGVDERIVKYLPTVTDEEWESMPSAHKKKRENWGRFETISVGRIKRIALISLEKFDEHPVVMKWRKKYGGKPLEIELQKVGNMNDETLKIKKLDLDEFRRFRGVIG